jgi:hypothetical protein
MAKISSKSPAKEPKKAPAKTSTPKTASNQIEKVSSEVLDKLKSLNIEQELQNDLEWCLGSFRADKNPVGLYAMLERAHTSLQAEKAKKTKGVTTKLIADIEKALSTR